MGGSLLLRSLVLLWHESCRFMWRSEWTDGKVERWREDGREAGRVKRERGGAEDGTSLCCSLLSHSVAILSDSLVNIVTKPHYRILKLKSGSPVPGLTRPWAPHRSIDNNTLSTTIDHRVDGRGMHGEVGCLFFTLPAA
ncbi:hypothetical protein P152DRAFT_155357 [Eremomyces bilateralis CBS 781.70]|uniref:Secreted protein n=1 Tax=Eremomyces bilateralis CBS 781.70 TaxID=1392243 RepID=A0A6G1FVC5_9PEZI|nr:uncharacterized protein P152DRAFT_155357 [Eremomyces bilateralis CBS 781.70]KAF1809632.1 hypothetical protein P152DRAFT_155357 [Eremomyces bilateralis CBS 781.70]